MLFQALEGAGAGKVSAACGVFHFSDSGGGGLGGDMNEDINMLCVLSTDNKECSSAEPNSHSVKSKKGHMYVYYVKVHAAGNVD